MPQWSRCLSVQEAVLTLWLIAFSPSFPVHCLFSFVSCIVCDAMTL